MGFGFSDRAAMENFPGNSNSARMHKPTDKPEEAKTEAAAPKKSADRVVTGKVSTKKKPIGERFKSMFITDGAGYAEFLVQKVLIPKAKDTLDTIITQALNGIAQGIQEAIHGGPAPDHKTGRTTTVIGGNRPPLINYNQISRSSSTITRSTQAEPRILRRSNVLEDIVLPTREDCNAVIGELTEVIQSVGHCTVGDLYVCVGIQPNQTDEGWGWNNLRGAGARQLTTGEYVLVMPKPIEIQTY